MLMALCWAAVIAAVMLLYLLPPLDTEARTVANTARKALKRAPAWAVN